MEHGPYLRLHYDWQGIKRIVFRRRWSPGGAWILCIKLLDASPGVKHCAVVDVATWYGDFVARSGFRQGSVVDGFEQGICCRRAALARILLAALRCDRTADVVYSLELLAASSGLVGRAAVDILLLIWLNSIA